MDDEHRSVRAPTPLDNRRIVSTAAVTSLVGVTILVAWMELWRPARQPTRATLAASTANLLADETRPPPPDLTFERMLTHAIKQRGYLSVTIHVGLADYRLRSLSPVPREMGQGDDPRANQYWGARFGLDTYLANDAGWQRVYEDGGNGSGIVRRSIFHRRFDPSPAWMERDIRAAFDVFVLACAWESDRLADAANQPLVDAVGGESIHVAVGDRDISFGGASQIVGFIGQNPTLGGLKPTLLTPAAESARRGPVGVFSLCWKSAATAHQDVVSRGLYPIAFVRQQIVPEGYLAAGILDALAAGSLDDGFLDSAAAAYAGHQRTVSLDRAKAMLFR